MPLSGSSILKRKGFANLFQSRVNLTFLLLLHFLYMPEGPMCLKHIYSCNASFLRSSNKAATRFPLPEPLSFFIASNPFCLSKVFFTPTSSIVIVKRVSDERCKESSFFSTLIEQYALLFAK